jgi:hypothetical protein
VAQEKAGTFIISFTDRDNQNKYIFRGVVAPSATKERRRRKREQQDDNIKKDYWETRYVMLI